MKQRKNEEIEEEEKKMTFVYIMLSCCYYNNLKVVLFDSTASFVLFLLAQLDDLFFLPYLSMIADLDSLFR
jgi:hypothetical protein